MSAMGSRSAASDWLGTRRDRLARAQAHSLDPDILVPAMGGGLDLVAQPLPVGGEPPMQRRGAEKLDADRDEPRAGLSRDRAERLLRCGSRRPLRRRRPARSTRASAQRALSRISRRGSSTTPSSTSTSTAPFGARLANAAALEIARIDDEGIAAQDLVIMHMAERPIVITARREILDGARRVGVVRRPAGAGGVQHADVEPAGNRGRVGERVIFGDDPVREAAAMQHDLEVVEPEALGRAARKFAHIRRQGDALRHHAFGVVIALEEEDAGCRRDRALPIRD